MQNLRNAEVVYDNKLLLIKVKNVLLNLIMDYDKEFIFVQILFFKCFYSLNGNMNLCIRELIYIQTLKKIPLILAIKLYLMHVMSYIQNKRNNTAIIKNINRLIYVKPAYSSKV